MTQHDLSWLTARPIAHRGHHDMNVSRWENTLSAFRSAVDHGYAIECDVHLAADGIPVVFHDHELKRLTGREGHVDELTSAELATLSVGGTRDHVPSLRDMLALVSGKVPLVIELKGIEGQDDGLTRAVASALAAYPGKAAIMSFDHHIIRRFEAEAPGIPGGLTAEGTGIAEIEAHFSMLAHGIAFVSYNVDHLPNPFVSFVRERLSMPVITWTVRDSERVRRTYEHADQMTFEGFDPD